jgi:hypothetical protein
MNVWQQPVLGWEKRWRKRKQLEEWFQRWSSNVLPQLSLKEKEHINLFTLSDNSDQGTNSNDQRKIVVNGSGSTNNLAQNSTAIGVIDDS